MLQTYIPWLADGYRIKLQQEEKKRLDTVRPDDRDNFTLCTEEHISSYAELRIHSKPGTKPGFPQRRVLSAHGRLGGRGQTVSRIGLRHEAEGEEDGGDSKNGGGGFLTDEDKENHPWLSSVRQQLQPRPSSALASYRAKRSQETRPTSAFTSYRTGGSHTTRPTSAAVPGRHGGGSGHGGAGGGDSGRARPVSASAATTSPRKGRSPDPYTVRQQRIQAMRQAWADDPRSGLHIGGPNPGPAMFMDRHARCLDHTAVHDPGLWDRPHTACGDTWDQYRPDSAMSSEESVSPRRMPRDHMSRMQRYIDCHRPQTAPTTRRELEGMTRSKFKLHRRMPHFCNFVHSVNLHQRYSDSGGGPGRGSSASDDDNRLGSMGSEPTDKDLLAQWRKQSRFTPSGTEGRPGSPSSMVDGQNVLDPNTLVNGRMSEDEDEDKLSAKMIPTITIPSSPIPPADQGAGTQRSSGEDSPRKSAKEKPKEPTRQPISAPKPKPLPTSKPAAPKDKAPGADTPSGSAKGKRLPVAKKTKKGSDRKRKGKSSEMEEAQPAPAASGDPSGEVAVDQPPAQPAEVDLKVPDLPDFPASGKDKGKSPRKGDKHTISSPLGVGDAKPQLPPELLELTQRNGYDFGDMEDTINETAKPKFRSHSWLNNRMALSQQASRFELPMDMKSLEKMTTQEYLKKYCIVTSRRLNLYQKIFMKHKDKSNHITRAGLETCLKEVLVETLKENTLADLCDVLEVTDETQIDFKLFSGIAAIAERILYPYYTTEDTLEKAEYQREKIETADFGALDWKLNGVSITDNMRKLLKMIE